MVASVPMGDWARRSANRLAVCPTILLRSLQKAPSRRRTSLKIIWPVFLKSWSSHFLSWTSCCQYWTAAMARKARSRASRSVSDSFFIPLEALAGLFRLAGLLVDYLDALDLLLDGVDAN